jgi:hypothetical protein
VLLLSKWLHVNKKDKEYEKIYFPNEYYYYDEALKQKVSKRRVNRIKFRLYIRNFYAVEVIIIAVEEVFESYFRNFYAVEEVLGWCRRGPRVVSRRSSGHTLETFMRSK